MAVTIKDVARESGVNVSTVSRALNGEYGVHADTREHVVAVAQRLRYRPNRIARGLVTGRSQTLALVVSDLRNPFFAEVGRGEHRGPEHRLFGVELVERQSCMERKA
jgi:LacI family transcriptional regulator